MWLRDWKARFIPQVGSSLGFFIQERLWAVTRVMNKYAWVCYFTNVKEKSLLVEATLKLRLTSERDALLNQSRSNQNKKNSIKWVTHSELKAISVLLIWVVEGVHNFNAQICSCGANEIKCLILVLYLILLMIKTRFINIVYTANKIECWISSHTLINPQKGTGKIFNHYTYRYPLLKYYQRTCYTRSLAQLAI